MRLPTGTVTFLFTDIEGSTRLLHELGAEAYAEALVTHRHALRAAFATHGGVEVETQGDSFFVAFARAGDAVAAALASQAALDGSRISARMGLHTGAPILAADGYVGMDVHRAARIAAVANGAQVLLSEATKQLTPETHARDLGLHRLKDLGEPLRLFQLGDREFSPLRTLYRTNLPVPATAFLGRGAELAEVVELLAREDVQLLTLTGPGGAGKTRLALQAAAEVAHAFPDGLWWVPLAPLRDPSLVLQAVATTLGVRNEPQRELADTLAERLAGERLLVLLDNAEHLLPAIAGDVARLRDFEGPKLLVTSRERLQLQGEHGYAVPSLTRPDAEALFAARAAALGVSVPRSRTLDTLCGHLDDLPLALELAAARTTLFSPEQLLERLSQRLDLFKGGRDADPRQQTLRATIEWSHELLSEDEKQLFARLSVFVGGCVYEAAEQVAGADPDTLQSLLDKSLLRRRDTELEPRYWMLETIREYAAEQLDRTGEAEGRRRCHADWLLQLAGAADREAHISGGERWLQRLASELDNLRAALAWSVDVHSVLGLQLAALLWRFWDYRGLVGEGRHWLDIAWGADVSVDIRKQALRARAAFAIWHYDVAALSAASEELLGIARRTDDLGAAATALNGLGVAAQLEGDLDRARRCFEGAFEAIRETGGSPRAMLANLGHLARQTGDFAEARRLFESELAASRERGNEFELAEALMTLAELEVEEGALARAKPCLREGIEIAVRIGGMGLLPYLLRSVIVVAAASESELAARLYGATEALTEKSGGTFEPTGHAPTAPFRVRGELRATLGSEEFDLLTKSGRNLEPEDVVRLALDCLD